MVDARCQALITLPSLTFLVTVKLREGNFRVASFVLHVLSLTVLHWKDCHSCTYC